MAFEATKKEWGEIYAFFRILADGSVTMGTPDLKDAGETVWPVAYILREEHDGERRYYIEENVVRIVSEQGEKTVEREDFDAVAAIILRAIKEAETNDVNSPEGVEEFLDNLAIFDLEAKTQDRTDFSIAFWHANVPVSGFVVRSRLGTMTPLLDGGRSANLKFEQTGVKFSSPTVNKVNATPETTHEVAERMEMIQRLGGVLRYSDVADRVFRCNLLMIDLHFPRMLAEMLRIMHLDGITRISELTEMMKQVNPLKIKDELINKHGYYEFKMKQFLMALAMGMRPAKIYNGTDSAVEGMLLIDGKGKVYGFHKSLRTEFEEFLLKNTRFEIGALEKDKYGFLERENGVYYFKLNAKIGFVKR